MSFQLLKKQQNSESLTSERMKNSVEKKIKQKKIVPDKERLIYKKPPVEVVSCEVLVIKIVVIDCYCFRCCNF